MNGLWYIIWIYLLLFVPLTFEFLRWAIFQKGYRDLLLLGSFVFVAVKGYTWDRVAPVVGRGLGRVDAGVEAVLCGQLKTGYISARDAVKHVMVVYPARAWSVTAHFVSNETADFVESVETMTRPVVNAWREVVEESDAPVRPVKDQIQQTYYERKNE